jgi:integrase
MYLFLEKNSRNRYTMSQKSGIKPTKVSIDIYKNRIRLRWRYKKQRYTIYVGTNSKEVIEHAKKLSKVISEDIALKKFDLTLEKYKSKREKKISMATTTGSTVLSFYDLWIKTTNLLPTPYNVQTARPMIAKWGNIPLDDVPDVFCNEKLGASTFNTRLNILRRFFKWLYKKGHIPLNYLADVENRRNLSPKRKQRLPYSDDEIRTVLEAYRTDQFSKQAQFKHSHYYPFIQFVFMTGVRNGEAIGLQVRKIDWVKKSIVIDQSFSKQPLKSTNIKHRILKPTKTGRSRNLPLTPELSVILEPLCKGRRPEDFIFTTGNGNPIDDHMFQRRIHKPILKELGIEDRDLYACRHTFGTVALEQGFTVLEAAYLMGHSNPKTILVNYAHLRKVPNRLPNMNFERKPEE